MMKCYSNQSHSHTKCDAKRKKPGVEMSTCGIAEDILTKISSNLSGNVKCTQPDYPGGTVTLSPTSSTSTTVEADSSVVSLSGQF